VYVRVQLSSWRSKPVCHTNAVTRHFIMTGWINKKLEINSAKRQKFFSPIALRVALEHNQHSSHRIPRFFPMVR